MYIKTAERCRSNVALVASDSSKISYQQLLQRAGKIAKNIISRRLAFLVCDIDIDSIVAYTSLMMANAVVLLVNSNVTDRRLTALAQLYKPSYWFSHRARTIKAISQNFLAESGDYCLTRTIYREDSNIHDDLFLLLSTSGTTGNPKLVRLSERNVVSNSDAITDYLQIDESDRAIATLPMSYSYGLSVVHTHLSRGASIIIPESSIVEKQFWSLLKEEKATNLSGVPYVYETLDKIGFYRQTFPDLACLTQAGGGLEAKIASKMVKHCQATGKRYFTMYGQTEASPRMSFVPWDSALKKIGSIGRPIAGGRFWLEGEDEDVLELPNQVGELLYAGDNVMLGYAERREDLSKGDECRGLLRTGDLARRDDDGFYYIVGRKNRIAKILGLRLELDELEIELRNINIQAACCEVNGRLKAFILQSDAKDVVLQHLGKVTGLNKLLIDVTVVEHWPMTTSGKIAYSELSELGRLL